MILGGAVSVVAALSWSADDTLDLGIRYSLPMVIFGAVALFDGYRSDQAPGSIPSFDALRNFARFAPELLSAVAYWVVSAQAARTSKYVKELFLKGLPVEVFANEANAVRWIRERLDDERTARHA